MPSVRNNGFRINNRYVLLTYSQVGAEFNWITVCDLLHDLGAVCRCGRELHEDGGVHFHYFVDFRGPYSTRNCRVFDVEGAHPNIQPIPRTPYLTWDYVGKDGDVVHDCTEGRPPNGRPTGGSSRDVWTEIANAGDKDSFYELVAGLAPRQLVCSFTNVRAYADWKFREPEGEYTSPAGMETDVGAYPEIEAWVTGSLTGYTGGARFVCLSGWPHAASSAKRTAYAALTLYNTKEWGANPIVVFADLLETQAIESDTVGSDTDWQDTLREESRSPPLLRGSI